jgi:hypothetical protein
MGRQARQLPGAPAVEIIARFGAHAIEGRRAPRKRRRLAFYKSTEKLR